MEYSIAKFSNKANPEAEFEVLKNVAIILHNCHPYPLNFLLGLAHFKAGQKENLIFFFFFSFSYPISI